MKTLPNAQIHSLSDSHAVVFVCCWITCVALLIVLDFMLARVIARDVQNQSTKWYQSSLKTIVDYTGDGFYRSNYCCFNVTVSSGVLNDPHSARHIGLASRDLRKDKKSKNSGRRERTRPGTFNMCVTMIRLLSLYFVNKTYVYSSPVPSSSLNP